MAYYALRFGDLKSVDWAFSYLSDTPCSTPPGRAADLIASRIPPGRLVWLLGGWVVFFVLVVFFVFYVFVELVAVLGFLLVVGLLGCWAVAT